MNSILVLLLVGVVSSHYISLHDNTQEPKPMITKKQEGRICAELCMSGLGGEPCGESCLDVLPQELPSEGPSQSHYGTAETRDLTRRESCPVLCSNRLGFPLCNCTYADATRPFFKPNFLQICKSFCDQNYRLFGCDECHVYRNMTDSSMITADADLTAKSFKWNPWCIVMCQEGEGGAACNCDKLPMSLTLNI